MNISKTVAGLMTGILLALTTCHAMADDAPRLMLQMKHGLLAGTVKDGTRLGKGTLVSHETHAGFRLWADAQTVSPKAGHYVLSGKQNGAHQLHIRLVPQNLAAADKPGSAETVLNTADDRIAFEVLADGDQTVAADSYALNVSGALLRP